MDHKYPISVITPFHEVELDVFERSFKSVVAQDFGFEKIEYIIVVHNSGQSYLDGVLKLAEGHNNVKVLVLNNEIRTPSNPRNYGIDQSTGEYIVFLDADDTLYPDALSKSYQAITEEKAQMCLFRYDNLIGDNVVELHQLSLFDQTDERIVLYNGKYDQKKLIVGMNLVVHAKIIEGKFIRDNKFYFDESVVYSEDGLYNLYLFSEAEKIVILPQLIGESYYQHESSLSQRFKKSKDEVLSVCEGVVTIAEEGWKLGVYMDSYLFSIATMASLYLLCSDVDYSVLKRASELITPVVKMIKPLPYTKFDTKESQKTYKLLINLTYFHPRLASVFKKVLKILHIDLEKVVKGAVKV